VQAEDDAAAQQNPKRANAEGDESKRPSKTTWASRLCVSAPSEAPACGSDR
jgi:hypothetical protein